MTIKIFLIAFLLAAFVAYWLLPKTSWARRLRMSESLFYGMNILGVVFGLVGVVASVSWPKTILAGHYFELILLPVLLIYLYSGVAKKAAREDVYDEKQVHDMTKAAALAWEGSVAVILVVYALFKASILHGLVWFPVFVFATLVVYSASTLFYFRKG